ncbi:hypothetical protein BDQ17DRAFT_1361059 [Cyathus striatus]|nr:hypothetical protein BDQ17DRAFT_1361059 [Cyathus striatus]
MPSRSEYNPAISLEPSSIYVATSQRMAAPGTFHWAVVVTDNAGMATRTHWTLIDYSPSTYSKGNTATFAFFKIDGYEGVEWSTLWDCATTVFPEHLREGFPTVKQNRQAGISCRTWALGFLRRLIEAGILHRSIEEIPDWRMDGREAREWFLVRTSR